MENLFQLWRLTWGASAFPATLFAPKATRPVFATLVDPELDLPSMCLRTRRDDPSHAGTPILIVAPFALHDSSIADFAPQHSIAETLWTAGLGPIYATQWKSATRDMRSFGIDQYLDDLCRVISHIGMPVALVGLCQGGWLATAFTARFPEMISALVLAGAPIDIEAASSQITRSLSQVSSPLISSLVRLNGGRVIGDLALPIWSLGLDHPFDPQEALQRSDDPKLEAKADAWNKYTVDLPGEFFLQTTEWLFRENRLARNCFPALGQVCDLQRISCPIFVLAAQDDDVVALPQALAIKNCCTNSSVSTLIMPGRHLSLFLGRNSILNGWTKVARWLKKVARVNRSAAQHPEAASSTA